MKRNKTIIVGCGRLGSKVASLLSTNGRNVIMIDNDSESFRRLSDSFNGYTIEGDATDIDFLENTYIKECSCIIVATDNDDVNIFIAHIAKKLFEVPEVIVRLKDNTKSRLVEGMDIKAVYPFILSLSEISNIFDGGLN